MKTLIIVRHAKAEKGSVNMKDIDRPLNDRGTMDAYDMSIRTQEFIKGKPLFVTSPAVRTFSTAAIFADQSNYSRTLIKLDQNLYNSDTNAYLEMISTIEKHVGTLLVFGHNPIVSELISYLAGKFSGDIPTCSVAVFKFDSEDWQSINPSNSKLEALFSPKN